jgi:GMP synthase (glutamine-hydrolysing)
VVAALLAKAIGPQLSCIFVDNGFLRKNEAAQVRERFTRHFRTDLHVVDAGELFLSRLAGVVDPQRKREIIGHTFIDVFRKEAESIEGARFLAQGTLYPDVIESGSNRDGPAATIKTHHNVGTADFNPLRGLFKDEVRDLARLGLPDFISEQMPFPGFGLFGRLVGIPVTEETLDIVRGADAEVTEIMYKSGIEKEISQLIVALTVQTTGVKGDGRTLGYTVVVHAVQSIDFMTGTGYEIPSPVRRTIIHALTQHPQIVRVWFDETDKPPATFELQ